MLEVKGQLEDMIRSNQMKYFKIAIGYMKNKDDSLDVLHNAIVKSLSNYPKLRNTKYMDTWFCRILINECLTFIKKRGKELTVLEPDNYFKNDAKIDEGNKESLYTAINELDEDLKSIIILRYYNDMKISDIARIMNMNINTTKSKLYKALSILRREMEESHNDI